LPSLRLNYSYPDADGNPLVGSQDLIQPQLSSVEDLNGDDRPDLIMLEPAGNHQRTLVLLDCGNNRYLPVLDQMADGIAIEEDPRPEARGKSLRVEWIPTGSEHQVNQVLRWDGSTFARACEYSVPIDSLGIHRPGGCP
jgi:hypothetical protein